MRFGKKKLKSEMHLCHETDRWKRIWPHLFLSNEKALWFIIHAMTLRDLYGNPTRFYWCCGLQEAAEQLDYDRIRGWIAEHGDQARQLLDYYVEPA